MKTKDTIYMQDMRAGRRAYQFDLDPRARDGLRDFNDMINHCAGGTSYHRCPPSITRAQALSKMHQNHEHHESLICTAKAFREMYPHWFNGTQDKWPTGVREAMDDCRMVLDRLSRDEWNRPILTTPNFDALMSNMVIAAVRARGQGGGGAVAMVPGTGRGRKSYARRCRIHPEARNSGHGLCQTCRGRVGVFTELGLITDDTPRGLIDRVLNLPDMRNPIFYDLAVKVLEDHNDKIGRTFSKKRRDQIIKEYDEN